MTMTEIIINLSTDISSNSSSCDSSSDHNSNKKCRRNKIHYVMRRHHQNDRSSSMLLLLLQVLLITVLTTTCLTTTKTKPNVGLFVNSFSSTSSSLTSLSSSTVATTKGSQRQGGGRLSSISISSIRSGILTLPIERTTATTTTRLYAATTTSSDETDSNTNTNTNIDFALQNGKFNLNTALFCAGLAFDSYVEPPQDSSRWERGSKGMNVAFVSSKYTRNLYRGMVEVTPIEATDLPEEDSSIESVATGNGVDVCIMCAVVEGKLWEDDIKMLDTDSNHNGIFSLSGAAHVGRSRTAWANINEQKSKASKTKKNGDGLALPYHISKSFMKSGKSIWTDDERPYYMYVQDPTNVRLVFTLFDDDVVGAGSVISSTSISLQELIPKVNSNEDIIDKIKNDIVSKMVAKSKAGDELDVSKLNTEISAAITKVVETDYTWEGPLKMTIKPKIENKNTQIATGAAAGAMVAGPMGAAAGAAFGAFYEGQAKGTVKLKLRYLPVPPSTSTSKSNSQDNKYQVLGGLPGIDWGNLHELYTKEEDTNNNDDDEEKISSELKLLGGNDLEFCFFINHDKTGASVGVYRSLENKRIIVSFRGTCQPIDLITDASIFQVPWIESKEGEYNDKELKNIDHTVFPMVHVGFRKSMDSIARRLKTLVLGTVPPGESIEEYEILVTGHSLGGALATLFTADIGEYGIDAGRSLPTKTPSDPWWKGIASTFNLGDNDGKDAVPISKKGPPRPKSLKMYNFGSPRPGNTAFSNNFELMLKDGKIDEAYRIVNSQDIVARVPRPMLNLGVDYEHCGRTVLIEEPTSTTIKSDNSDTDNVLWIEGESKFERIDPVRDMKGATKGILSKGTFLDELVQTYKGDDAGLGSDIAIDAANALQQLVDDNDNDKDDASTASTTGNSNDFTSRLNAVATRLKSIDVADLTSVVGIDRNYANREIELASSFMKGDSLAHHLEDSYYKAMGRAVGYNTTVGEDIQKLV